MKNKYRIIIFIISIFGIIFLGSGHVFAQSIYLSSGKKSYTKGESFTVTLSINTAGKSINTVSGKIIVPRDLFGIVDVRYGNSIVTLWVEEPTIDKASNIISFTGGIPGGYSGSGGPILSFGVKAQAEGSGVLQLSQIKVLLNDGQGTEFPEMKIGSLTLTVQAASAQKPSPAKLQETPSGDQAAPSPTLSPAPESFEIYRPEADTTAPEPFIPYVSRHTSVADNQYFISFFAVDKDSGISHYEIREDVLFLATFLPLFPKKWESGESPYILKHQWLPARVVIRAYDAEGNYAESALTKSAHPVVFWVFAAAVLALTSVLSATITKKKYLKKQNMKFKNKKFLRP